MKRRGSSARSSGLQQSVGPAAAAAGSSAGFVEGAFKMARLLALISPQRFCDVRCQLSAPNNLVKRSVKSGLLRWHRRREESTCGNFNECLNLKHIGM